MAKIFLETLTPGNGKIYEFQLESSMTVTQVKAKMIDEITEIESGNITLKHDKALLYNLNSKQLLQEEETMKSAGVKSGDKMLLI